MAWRLGYRTIYWTEPAAAFVDFFSEKIYTEIVLELVLLAGGGIVDDWKRIMVSFPEQTLADIDMFAAQGKQSRNDFVREAIDAYLTGCRHEELVESMKRGYEEMASINLSLAEENLWQDWSGGGCPW